MSYEPAISVQNLGKCYLSYEKPHQRLLQMLFQRFGKTYHREFWALRNINISIPKGKVYGILGKNGAGKSTLLQIICGTLTPSHGEVIIHGRIAALLELGSGFNPEFTGIENIYLNGQILGLTRAEVDTKLESILDFADIGDFVYQPVKTYSSGMFTRLAFSVAVNVEPDILIVDEALSVGDAWFQHKSMARMRQLMESGCTVLFVSHSIDAVRALCDEAIWLEGGTIKMQGNVTDVTNSYMNDVFIENNRITLKNTDNTSQSSQSEAKENITELQQGNSTSEPTDQIVPDPQQNIGKVLSLHSKKLKNSAGEEVEFLKQGERFKLEFKIDINQSIDNISVGILLKDQFGQDLTGESFFNTHRHSLNFKAGQQPTFSFESSMMLRGGQSYSVAMRVNKVSRWDRSDNVIIYADELAMVFDVLTDNDNPMWFKFQMPFKVECQ